MELSAPRYQRALQERFYLYTALTASRERLYITYAASTLEGDSWNLLWRWYS